MSGLGLRSSSARDLTRSLSHNLSLASRFRRLSGSGTDAFTYGLLAVGYEATAIKIAMLARFTPAEAVALALGIWSGLMALAWRLMPGSGYMQHREQVVFGVRLQLVLMPLAVRLITRQAVPPLPEFLYILVLSGGWAAAVLLAAAFLPLPLPPHLLLSLVAAAVVPFNTRSICQEGFMRGPITEARLGAALRLLGRLGALRPLRGQLARLAPSVRCQAAMTSCHLLVAVVLPTVLVIELQAAAAKRMKRILERHPYAAARTAAAAAAAGGRRGGGGGAAAERAALKGGWLSVGNRVAVYLLAGQLALAGSLGGYALLGERQEALMA